MVHISALGFGTFAKICVIATALLAFACAGGEDSQTAALKKDAESWARLNQIATTINTRSIILPADYAELKKLRDKYPLAPDVRRVYKNALVVREDWGALEKLLLEAGTAISDEDRMLLGQSYVKSGRHTQVIETLTPLADRNQDEIEAKSLLSWSHFSIGQIDIAESYLQKIWPRVQSEKRVNEMALAGLIAQSKGDFAKAEEVLLAAYNIDPTRSAVTSALGQLYNQRGDAENARKFRDKTVELNQKRTAEEYRARLSVHKFYELETAWNQKKYADVVVKANDLLSSTSDKNKRLILFQYLHEAYKGLGNQPEADRTLLEAQKLKSQ